MKGLKLFKTFRYFLGFISSSLNSDPLSVLLEFEFGYCDLRFDSIACNKNAFWQSDIEVKVFMIPYGSTFHVVVDFGFDAMNFI